MGDKLMLPGLGESCDESYVVKISGRSPVLLSHHIEVREYVNALSGYEGFVRHVARNILRAEVVVSVASEREGSFESHVHVFMEAIGAVSSVLGILSFFGVSAKSMGQALSGVQSAIISKYIEFSGDLKRVLSGIVEYSNLSDEEKHKLLEALSDESFLESLDQFTSPLDSEGYDLISVYDKDRELFNVRKDDRNYFKYVPPASEKTEFFEDTVEILYISPELIKWKFKGKETFWADVLDNKFLESTSNMKSTELKGVKFVARGRKVSRRKEGGKKWVVTWYIDNMEECHVQLSVI